MQSKKKRKVYAYNSEADDDFSGMNIKVRKVGRGFAYSRRSLLWRFLSFFTYYFIAVPVAWAVSEAYMGLRFTGRISLRKLRGGCFLYGNHTRALDAFLAPLAAFPKRVYTVAGPEAVSIPGLRTLVMLLGCIPVPTESGALPRFKKEVEDAVRRGHCVVIFPEAHIWSFYTGIRRFPSVSFTYPVDIGAPVAVMTSTYRKNPTYIPGFEAKPLMTVHISRPMYPDTTLSRSGARDALCQRVYGIMRGTASAAGNYNYIQYRRADEPEKASEA